MIRFCSIGRPHTGKYKMSTKNKSEIECLLSIYFGEVYYLLSEVYYLLFSSPTDKSILTNADETGFIVNADHRQMQRFCRENEGKYADRFSRRGSFTVTVRLNGARDSKLNSSLWSSKISIELTPSNVLSTMFLTRPTNNDRNDGLLQPYASVAVGKNSDCIAAKHSETCYVYRPT